MRGIPAAVAGGDVNVDLVYEHSNLVI